MRSHILIANIFRCKDEMLVVELDPVRVRKLRNVLIVLFAILVVGGSAGTIGGFMLARNTIKLYSEVASMQETMAMLKYNVASVKEYVQEGANAVSLQAANKQLAVNTAEKLREYEEMARKDAKKYIKAHPVTKDKTAAIPYGIGGDGE